VVASRTEALIRAQIAQRSGPLTPYGRRRRRKDTITTIGFLIYRHIMWQSSQEVQLSLNPSQDLFWWNEHLEIPEAD
jgi:hypothetical protein